jgi:IS30 family transposase
MHSEKSIYNYIDHNLFSARNIDFPRKVVYRPRTRIFYCDPSAPYQKGAVENNRELIRKIVPKGDSFNSYLQKDISLMMDHVNSYGRKKLNDRSPYSVFSFLHGVVTLKKLGSELISPNEVILRPKLLKK